MTALKYITNLLIYSALPFAIIFIFSFIAQYEYIPTVHSSIFAGIYFFYLIGIFIVLGIEDKGEYIGWIVK